MNHPIGAASCSLWFYFAFCGPIRCRFQLALGQAPGALNGVVVAHYRAAIPLQWLLYVLDRCPVESTTFQTRPFWIPIPADYLSIHFGENEKPQISL